MTTFKSYGRIEYREGNWISLMTCPDLPRYYRATLTEKPQLIQSPMHGSHITICNGRWEDPANKEVWGKYEGKWIEFTYSNDIRSDHRFFWIAVECPFIIRMREELGLHPLRGHKYLRRGMHITLARRVWMG